MPTKSCRPAHPPQLREDPRQTCVGIWGKNRGAIARRNIVLAAFFEQLLKDERVLALFRRWSELLGDVLIVLPQFLTRSQRPKSKSRDLIALVSQELTNDVSLF